MCDQTVQYPVQLNGDVVDLLETFLGVHEGSRVQDGPALLEKVFCPQQRISGNGQEFLGLLGIQILKVPDGLL